MRFWSIEKKCVVGQSGPRTSRRQALCLFPAAASPSWGPWSFLWALQVGARGPVTCDGKSDGSGWKGGWGRSPSAPPIPISPARTFIAFSSAWSPRDPSSLEKPESRGVLEICLLHIWNNIRPNIPGNQILAKNSGAAAVVSGLKKRAEGKPVALPSSLRQLLYPTRLAALESVLVQVGCAFQINFFSWTMKHANLEIAITTLFLPLSNGTAERRVHQASSLPTLALASGSHLLLKLDGVGLHFSSCCPGEPGSYVWTVQSLASWMSVLPGAEWAVTKHRSVFWEWWFHS